MGMIVEPVGLGAIDKRSGPGNTVHRRVNQPIWLSTPSRAHGLIRRRSYLNSKGRTPTCFNPHPFRFGHNLLSRTHSIYSVAQIEEVLDF